MTIPIRPFLLSALFISLVGRAQEATTLPSWGFDNDAEGWRAARHLGDLKVRDGILHGRTNGHDPQLISPLFELKANAYQEVVARVRFSQAGKAAVFYSNTTKGKYDGFSGKKVIEIPVQGGAWETIRCRPFWQAEKQIVHVRFDPPPNADVEIDWIRIEEPIPAGQAITQTRFDIDPGKGWKQAPDQRWLAPPLCIPIKGRDWLRVSLPPCASGHLQVRWTTDAGAGLKTASVFLGNDGWAHAYDFDLSATPAWSGNLLYMDIRATTGRDATIKPLGVELADQLLAAADLRCLALAPENAANRLGMPCTFLLRLLNTGGKTAEDVRATLTFQDAQGKVIPAAQIAAQYPPELAPPLSLATDRPHTFLVTVTPRTVGPITPVLALTHAGRTRTHTGRAMHVLPAVNAAKATYVLEPKPARTDYLIASYYYPGYGSAYQYRQMERTAPWAKPALGWYDEGNPECIDWQIKWAVEHGVNCFLVDWYWVAGKMGHKHYLEGFAKARYRKHMKWAVMWANHNPPKTHSREDWRNVTQFWLDNYFQTPEYLRLDGRPVVAIWSPSNIRNDLGGSDGAKELLDTSQAMARKAGLPGIHFIAMNNGGSTEQLKAEGYRDRTWYHWWGDAREKSLDRSYTDFADVVREAPPAWEKRGAQVKEAGMGFLPVADTGWDARPRHGDRTFVIHNRTPELFRQHLADAKRWLDKNDQRFLVLAPWNEWTEGSYIEPCAEFDFRMLEAIHSVFAKSPLPRSVTPRDVGLGRYDFDLSQPGSTRSDWTFDTEDALGWRPLMGLKDWAPTTDGLVATSTTHDPALLSEWLDHDAADLRTIEITLSVSPAPAAGKDLVVFWETDRAPVNSRALVGVPLKNDTDEHTYRLDLGAHPRWRGRIRRLRVDP
ncbi:MAG: hypothetical protein HN849_14555, partial [Victivallales bacterium]|nr:hypothetical protein [Victivallales bacterium]